MKKAISPLTATLILVVFALIIGAITMSWGKSYVEGFEEEKPVTKTAIIISIEDIDTPLKDLQIQYLTGRISLKEYLDREKGLI